MRAQEMYELFLSMLKEAEAVVDGAAPPGKQVELEFALAKFITQKVMPIIQEERKRANRQEHLYLDMSKTIDRLDNKIRAIQYKVVSTCKKCKGTGALLDEEISTPNNMVSKPCPKCVERVTVDDEPVIK